MARHWCNEREKYDGYQQEKSCIVLAFGPDLTVTPIFLQLIPIPDLVDQQL